MKKLVAILSAVMFVFLAVLPACAGSSNSNSSEYTMYVTSSNGGIVHVRTEPSKQGKVVNNLGVGRPVTVINQANRDWSEIQYKVNGKTKHGYIMTNYLTAKDPATKKQTFKDVKKDIYLKVMPASANGIVSMWSKTSKRNSDKVRDLGRNETMLVVSESNAWYLVSAADGELGYVAKAYVTKI